jgi:hypothetical protein
MSLARSVPKVRVSRIAVEAGDDEGIPPLTSDAARRFDQLQIVHKNQLVFLYHQYHFGGIPIVMVGFFKAVCSEEEPLPWVLETP